MDPIRPIGPVERDLEPIIRVTRTSPDAQRERRKHEDDQPPPRRQPPAPERPTPPEDEGGSLIDIKV